MEKHVNVVEMQTHLIYVPSDPLDHIVEVGREEKVDTCWALWIFIQKIRLLNGSLLRTRWSWIAESKFILQREKKSNLRLNFNPEQNCETVISLTLGFEEDHKSLKKTKQKKMDILMY